MAETSSILVWTLVSECPIPDDVIDLMVEGEVAVAAYKTFRDSAIFTNKRLIVRDAQGLTGKKVEVYSLPYSSINMWSTENAGRFWILMQKLSCGQEQVTLKLIFKKVLTLGSLINLLQMLCLNSF